MDGRKRQALELLRNRRQEILPLVNQALEEAAEQVPEIGGAAETLSKIPNVGEKTALEILFGVWLLIEEAGAWDQLVDGSTLDGLTGPCRRGGGGLLR